MERNRSDLNNDHNLMNAVLCLLLKFILLLKPSKDKLHDLIVRDYGRKRLKDVFSYIATEKKKEK